MENIFTQQIDLTKDQPTVTLAGTIDSWNTQIENSILEAAPFLYGNKMKTAINDMGNGQYIGQCEVDLGEVSIQIPLIIKDKKMFSPDIFLYEKSFWPLKEQYIKNIGNGTINIFEDPVEDDDGDDPFRLAQEARASEQQESSDVPYMDLGGGNTYGQKLANFMPFIMAEQDASMKKMAAKILSISANEIPKVASYLHLPSVEVVKECLEGLDKFANSSNFENIGLIKAAKLNYNFSHHCYEISTLADTGNSEMEHVHYDDLTKHAFVDRLLKLGATEDQVSGALAKLAAPDQGEGTPDVVINGNPKSSNYVILSEDDNLQGSEVKDNQVYSVTRAVDGAPVKAKVFQKVISMFSQKPVDEKLAVAVDDDNKGQYSLQAKISGGKAGNTANILKPQESIDSGEVYSFHFGSGKNEIVSVPVKVTSVSSINDSIRYVVDDPFVGRSYTIQPHNADSLILDNDTVYIPANFKVIPLTRKTVFTDPSYSSKGKAKELVSKVANFYINNNPNLATAYFDNPGMRDVFSGYASISAPLLPKTASKDVVLAMSSQGVNLTPGDIKKLGSTRSAVIIYDKPTYACELMLNKKAFNESILSDSDLSTMIKLAVTSPDKNLSRNLVQTGIVAGGGSKALKDSKYVLKEAINQLSNLLYASRTGEQVKLPGGLVLQGIDVLSKLVVNL